MIRIVLFSLNTYIHNAFEKRFIRGNDISSKLCWSEGKKKMAASKDIKQAIRIFYASLFPSVSR